MVYLRYISNISSPSFFSGNKITLSGESAFASLKIKNVSCQFVALLEQTHLLEIKLQIQHFPATARRCGHFVPQVWTGSTTTASFALCPVLPDSSHSNSVHSEFDELH